MNEGERKRGGSITTVIQTARPHPPSNPHGWWWLVAASYEHMYYYSLLRLFVSCLVCLFVCLVSSLCFATKRNGTSVIEIDPLGRVWVFGTKSLSKRVVSTMLCTSLPPPRRPSRRYVICSNGGKRGKRCNKIVVDEIQTIYEE